MSPVRPVEATVDADAANLAVQMAETAPLWVRIPVQIAIVVVLGLLIGFVARERTRAFWEPFRLRRGPATAPSFPKPRTLIKESGAQRTCVIAIAIGGLVAGLIVGRTVGGWPGIALLVGISGPASLVARRIWSRVLDRAIDRAIAISSELGPEERRAFLSAAEEQWGRRETRRLREHVERDDVG
jgi:hypothetical protein